MFQHHWTADLIYVTCKIYHYIPPIEKWPQGIAQNRKAIIGTCAILTGRVSVLTGCHADVLICMLLTELRAVVHERRPHLQPFPTFPFPPAITSPSLSPYSHSLPPLSHPPPTHAEIDPLPRSCSSTMRHPKTHGLYFAHRRTPS